MRALTQALRRLIHSQKQGEMFSAIARGAGISFAIRVLGFGLGYVVQVLLARWMGVAEYGTYAYVFAWATFLTIPAGLGLPTAVLRFIPEYKTKGDWARLRGVIRRSGQLTLFASLGLSSLGTILGLGVFQGSPYSTPFLFGIWMLPLLALSDLQSEMSRALHRMTLSLGPPMILQRLLMIGGAAALLFAGYSLTSLPVIGMTMVTFLITLIVQRWLFYESLPRRVHQAVPVYETREWVRVALPLLIVAGFQVALHRIDILMIGALMGPEDVGIYNVAARTAMFVNFVLMATNAIAAPMFASVYAQKNREGLQRLTSIVAHMSFWPSLASASFLIVFAQPLLGLFGQEFIAGRWVMITLVLGQLVSVGAGSVGYLLNMTGHQNQSAVAHAWCVLVNIVLNAIGIPLWGMMGAALATASTVALRNIWLYFLVVKNLGVRP
ncbi:MAG: polysaccharide biosynthesis protein, partial [Candidatus Fraserbacteria bacterium RBG_16_55_9]